MNKINIPATIAFLLFSTIMYGKQAPGNDNFSGATEVTLDSIGYYYANLNTYTNTEATGDGVQPESWTTTPALNVWFKFKPQSDTTDIVAIRGTAQYLRLAIYYDADSVVTGSEHFPRLENAGILGIGLDTARYYYLSVDSYSGAGGTFGLKIESELTCNYFLGAETITLDSIGYYYADLNTYTNNAATGDGLQPDIWTTAPSRNVWFKFKPQSDTIDIAAIRGTAQYLRLAIYYDLDSVVTSSEQFPRLENAGVLGIGLDTTRYYHLSVDSYSNPGGTFGLKIESELTYNYFSGAQTIVLDSTGYYYANNTHLKIMKLQVTVLFRNAGRQNPGKMSGSNLNLNWILLT